MMRFMSQPAAMVVVDFFDTLIRSDLPVQVVCDRTAHFLGCPVGFVDRHGTRTASVPRESVTEASSMIPDGAVRRSLASGEMVWIGAGERNSGVDDSLLELFGTAVKVAAARGRRWSVTAAGVRSAIGSGTLEERRDALRSLGLGRSEQVRLFAVAGPEAGRGQVVDELRERVGGSVFTAPVGQVTAVLVASAAGQDRLLVREGNHLGISTVVPADDAPHAWQQAMAALRFSQPATRTARDHSVEEAVQLRYDVMYPYAALADAWTADRIAGLPDVRALDTLIRQEGGDMLRTLDVVAATDSFREAARQLHTHHSTVAARVSRSEKALGFSLSENYGRSRLVIGLMMRRLRASSDLL